MSTMDLPTTTQLRFTLKLRALSSSSPPKLITQIMPLAAHRIIIIVRDCQSSSSSAVFTHSLHVHFAIHAYQSPVSKTTSRLETLRTQSTHWASSPTRGYSVCHTKWHCRVKRNHNWKTHAPNWAAQGGDWRCQRWHGRWWTILHQILCRNVWLCCMNSFSFLL